MPTREEDAAAFSRGVRFGIADSGRLLAERAADSDLLVILLDNGKVYAVFQPKRPATGYIVIDRHTGDPGNWKNETILLTRPRHKPLPMPVTIVDANEVDTDQVFCNAVRAALERSLSRAGA